MNEYVCFCVCGHEYEDHEGGAYCVAEQVGYGMESESCPCVHFEQSGGES